MNPLIWYDWSNPVSVWWACMVLLSVLNIALWIWANNYFKRNLSAEGEAKGMVQRLLWLSMIYVFVCAFRGILPRADVQRICLFNSWVCSIFVGRTVATIGEVSFVAQWAIVIRRVSQIADSKFSEKIANWIVPLILMAECCSWYAVITTNYFGNTIEESTWTLTYFLIAVSLFVLTHWLRGRLRAITFFAAISSLVYVGFMVGVDVPMYWNRFLADLEAHKRILGILEGIADLNTRWTISHDIRDWHQEIPWMSGYFSIGVWTSIALCFVPLERDRLHKYLKK